MYVIYIYIYTYIYIHRVRERERERGRVPLRCHKQTLPCRIDPACLGLRECSSGHG